ALSSSKKSYNSNRSPPIVFMIQKGVFKTNGAFFSLPNSDAFIMCMGFNCQPPLSIVTQLTIKVTINNKKPLFLICILFKTNGLNIFTDKKQSKIPIRKLNQKSFKKSPARFCIKSPKPSISKTSAVVLFEVYL